MATQARITTPFVTPEQAAEMLGVPKSRANRLIRWAKESKENAVTKAKADGSNGKIRGRKLGNK